MKLQTLIALPAIGHDNRTGRYDLPNKSNQAASTNIWNLLKTYTAKAFRLINLYSCHYNSLLFYLSAKQPFFYATDVGLINFNMAMQQISSRSNHHSTQFVKPAPSCLVTPKPENSLKPQGITAKLLIRNMPRCHKPYAQWFTSTLKYCTGCHRSLPLTASATNLLPRRQPSFSYTTGRANKSFWPTQTKQIPGTGGFIWKPFVKFLHSSRIINTANRMLMVNWTFHEPVIQLRERNGYPI